MKSKRLISLLLSAALAVSSVPMMMATAVSAAKYISIKYDMVYPETVTYPGEANNVTGIDNGNYYLHVGNRQDARDAGLKFTLGTAQGGVTYYISFDQRFSVSTVPGNNNLDYLRFENQNGGANVLNGNGTYWKPTGNCTSGRVGSTSGTTTLVNNTTWSHYELKYEIAEGAANSALNLRLRGGTNDSQRTPYDIDNFSVYTYVESEEGIYYLDAAGDYKLVTDPSTLEEGTKLYNKVAVFDTLTYDFEDGKIDSKFTITNGAKLSIMNTADVSGNTNNAKYVAISPDDEGAVWFSYDIDDIYLYAGEYKLSSDMLVRYSTWYNSMTGSAMTYSNKFDAVVTAIVDGKSIVLDDSATYGVDWTDFEDYVLELPNGGTLEEIIVTSEEINAPNPTAIHIKNQVTLALIQEVAYAEVFDSNDETNLLNGVKAVYSGAAERQTPYFNIPERSNALGNDQRFLDITINEAPVAGRTYYLGYMLRGDSNMLIRHSVVNFPLNEQVAGVVTTDGLANRYIIPSENNAATAGWSGSGTSAYPYICPTNEWKYVENYFTPAEGETTSAQTNINIQLNRGVSNTQIQAMDIDDVVLYYYNESDEKVVVYENNFNTEVINPDNATGTISTRYTSGDKKLNISVVPGSVTVTPFEGETAGVTYDVSKVANRTGAYTFTATVASATAGTASVAVAIDDQTEEGKTVEGTTVDVTAEGAELTYTVELEAGETIKSIGIVTTIAAPVTISGEYLGFEKTNAIIGDVDGNDKVTPLDLTWFARYLANWKGYAAKVISDSLDIDGDGEVTSVDATYLARHIAKWNGYEDIDGIKIDADPANDKYVVTSAGTPTNHGKKSAYELGLPVAYGELYVYGGAHATATNGIVELETGERVERVYSYIELNSNRIYRVDENNVVYEEDALKQNTVVAASNSHWLNSLPVKGAWGTRDYAKYGIEDATADGNLNYLDYQWYVNPDNAEAATAKLEAYKTANGVEALAEIPANPYELDLRSQVVTAAFDENGYLSVSMGNKAVITPEDEVTELVVVNQTNLATYSCTADSEDSTALTVLCNSPRVGLVGNPDRGAAYAEFLAKSLEDGIAVFMVAYDNSEA